MKIHLTPDWYVLVDSENWVLAGSDSIIDQVAANTELTGSVADKVSPELIEQANNVSLAMNEVATQLSQMV